MCSSGKYPYPPPPTKGTGNSRKGGVVSKAQKFKAMYEATLEFTERWGGGIIGQILSTGRCQYFLELNNVKYMLFLCSSQFSY